MAYVPYRHRAGILSARAKGYNGSFSNQVLSRGNEKGSSYSCQQLQGQTNNDTIRPSHREPIIDCGQEVPQQRPQLGSSKLHAQQTKSLRYTRERENVRQDWLRRLRPKPHRQPQQAKQKKAKANSLGQQKWCFSLVNRQCLRSQAVGRKSGCCICNSWPENRGNSVHVIYFIRISLPKKY